MLLLHDTADQGQPRYPARPARMISIASAAVTGSRSGRGGGLSGAIMGSTAWPAMAGEDVVGGKFGEGRGLRRGSCGDWGNRSVVERPPPEVRRPDGSGMRGLRSIDEYDMLLVLRTETGDDGAALR